MRNSYVRAQKRKKKTGNIPVHCRCVSEIVSVGVAAFKDLQDDCFQNV